jgi:ATP-dependent DNA ligase
MLPIDENYAVMEAKRVPKLPTGTDWQYEPKWDGFRCLAFKENKQIHLVSKSGQTLERYFPEVVKYLADLNAKNFVLDGELVIPQDGTFSFDSLLQRIHPASSRVNRLAEEIPAQYIVFDLLVDQNRKALIDKPLIDRRKKLDTFAERFFPNNSDILLSPACDDLKLVEQWHKTLGKKLDGIVAKNKTLSYQSGNRKGMVKVKWLETADCVVGGFRYASGDRESIGSLLLGLYDDKGLLNHVGFTSSFNKVEKKEILQKLKTYIGPAGFSGNAPGGPSRWSTERSADWTPLKSELVVEVQFDQFTGGRFRHGTKFMRWRPDKKPKQCTYDQLSS